MRRFCPTHISLTVLAFVVMGGCASTPEPQPEPIVEERPEVTLNLPEPTRIEACDCDAIAALEENDFDRGVRALAARDYEQAKKQFEKHRALGTSEAQREADVGIAFVTLMSEASRGAAPGAEGVDERAEVMILALAAVQTLEGRLETLDALNKALSKDLEKREDALKRLRDLTLGQQEGGR